MNQLNLDRLLRGRHKDGLHRPRAQAGQEPLRLPQPILIPAMIIRQQAREELKGTKADRGLGGGKIEHGGEAAVEAQEAPFGHGGGDDLLDRHGLGAELLRGLDVLRGEGAICMCSRKRERERERGENKHEIETKEGMPLF